jgi:Mg2+/Co2+ transporter CorB
MDHASFSLIIIVLLLVFSAFFSFSETCLTVLNQNKIVGEAERKNHKAFAVLKLLKNKDRLISTILFGNTLINVLMSSIITNESNTRFGSDEYMILVSLIITFMILIFGEVLPKNLALMNPEKSSMFVAKSLNVVVKIFYPITFLLQSIVAVFFRIFGIKPVENKNSLIGEIKDLVAVYKTTEHHHEKSAVNMISGVSSINFIKVSQIMVHRTNVNLIDLEHDTIDDIFSKVIDFHHSRIPVLKSDGDVIGILHVRELIPFIKSGVSISKEDLIGILHKPLFVYENISLYNQLNRFRSERKHMGIVIDEYSVFLGIITLEDVIEKIVGSINDEYDFKVQEMENTDCCEFNMFNGVEFDADISIHDLILKKVLEIDDYNDYTTLAGFIIENIERIPDENELIILEGYSFQIKEKISNKIEKVFIKKLSSE